jgi:citrate lyase gamma subunit
VVLVSAWKHHPKKAKPLDVVGSRVDHIRMDNQTKVMQELEDHIRRVIEQPQPNNLNVSDMRVHFMKALEHYIDGRIHAALERGDAKRAV